MSRWFLNFSFDGRARRSHAWANLFAWLTVFIVLFAAAAAGRALQNLGLTAVAELSVLAVACIALADHTAMVFRRAHDTGRSGWVAAMLLVPIVNLLALYWLLIEDGHPRSNRHGPSIKVASQPPGGAFALT